MAEGRSEAHGSVVAAIASNVAIAVAKLVVAGLTGSSAMLSEAIHSLVDTGNGGLLWIGMRRARRPPDAAHPFGHGMELYFWTTVVSILVFAVGGGMSVYEGVSHLLAPAPAARHAWSYAVLGISAAFEGSSWLVAAREFARAKRDKGVWEEIRTTKDPLVFAVLLEDSAALLGIVLAAAGIGLADLTGVAAFDGAASVGIGLLLMAVSVLLARESRGLLTGESADPATLAEVKRLAGADPAVRRVGRALTIHFGPRTIVLNLELEFRGGLSVGDAAAAVTRIEDALKVRVPDVRYVFIEGRALGAPA